MLAAVVAQAVNVNVANGYGVIAQAVTVNVGNVML